MLKLKKSSQFYERSKKVIAGPSTFGKGSDQFAFGITPYALEKAKGAYTWDVDGNKYLDTIMALGPVILGYNHPYINKALKKQLGKGISFSLPHYLEVEVAEMICERIPCADQVRFGKNGNDVTSAAIRLSRHITGGDHVLFCGYHGWQDWYACQTSMNGGIPRDIKKYSHRFKYNDLDDLEELLIKYNGNTACIIMEATNIIKPKKGYLESVRKLANKYNIILIFDEIVTGFRFHRGGYQAVCKVTPDLATFSKAISNGMPLSVLAGKDEYMNKCPEIYYSMTFAGESLSLAAARATMEILDEENAPLVINNNGKFLMDSIQKIISNFELDNTVSIIGYPCRNVLSFDSYKDIDGQDIRTYWIQELAKRKILTAGTHMLSLAYGKKELDYLIKIYSDVLEKIKMGLINNNILEQLQCPTAKESARTL